MSDIINHRENHHALPVPSPREAVGGANVRIRPASLNGADLVFIDQLQKQHSKMVGFLSLQVFKTGLAREHLLIAEDAMTTERLGYMLFNDKYLKREELGICYQLNVAPSKRRGLIGASLVKAAFERCAWGVKLFCCWCAQDIEANYFWESIGFVPIAYRAGSRGVEDGGKRKGGSRVQIFWQKRIRQGDVETNYWFPSETSGGAMKENRIVLPMMPGTHWSEAKRLVLPEGEGQAMEVVPKSLPGGSKRSTRKAAGAGAAKTLGMKPPAPTSAKHGLWFRQLGGAGTGMAAVKSASSDSSSSSSSRTDDATPVKAKKARRRNEPKYIAAARELRDKYLAQVSAGLILPESACGKYQVSRSLPPSMHAGELIDERKHVPLLKAA